jgi:hypothetical protein
MFTSVSCECCKNRSRCCDVVTISNTCCMCINLDVAKVDLDVSLFQTSSFDVADTCCWVLQILNFNVADVEFSLLQTCDVWVSRRRGTS